MAEQRTGRQTPTQSVVIPYRETKGPEAVRLYNNKNRACHDWQQLQIYDIMAVDENGLWIHMKYGLAVPRRNGKNEVVIMRELWGLKNGEKIMHTAHRTTTSHSAWERLIAALERAGYHEGTDFKSTAQKGLETITMLIDGGGSIQFRTRSSKGGLGEGYDLLIIDEAQEYTTDQESALQYVVTDSRNPQTIMTGTPPTAVSVGTVFTDFRNDVFAKAKEGGWAEWSVEKLYPAIDMELEDLKVLWYEVNPSLGLTLTERSVADESRKEEIDYCIQRLGLWLLHNQKSAISQTEWEELQLTAAPKLQKRLFAAIKYGKDGTNVALSVSVKTKDDLRFVECIDCRSVRDGNGWIVDYMKRMKPEKMGFEKIGNASPGLCKLVASSVCESTYRAAARQVSELSGQSISAQGAWNIVQHLGQRQKERIERNAVLAKESQGTGTIETKLLYEENDGIWLHLQGKAREEYGRSKEMKVGIAYDGVLWTENRNGDKRRTLNNKIAYSCFDQVKEFRANKEGLVASTFNVDAIELRVINGDGASWIQKQKGTNTISVLDAYHRNKKIRECVKDPEKAKLISEVLYEKSTDELLEYLEAAITTVVEDEEREGLQELYSYYYENKDSMQGYYDRGIEIPPTREPGELHHARLGSMESNIFTLVGNRMKGRRFNWSIQGANNLSSLLCAYHTTGMEGLFAEMPKDPEIISEWVDDGKPLSAKDSAERVGKGYEYIR